MVGWTKAVMPSASDDDDEAVLRHRLMVRADAALHREAAHAERAGRRAEGAHAIGVAVV
jgi:hypothetical protein